MSGNLKIAVVFAVVFLGYPEIFANQEKNFFPFSSSFEKCAN